MNIEVFTSPIVQTFEAAKVYEGSPEITNINYDLGSLKITAQFPNIDDPNIDDPVFIIFENARGFRVLDEGDLLEFWNPETRAEGWLWVVIKGGWFDLESIRGGFVSGITSGYCEYLILGNNDCVSVITSKEPLISKPKP